MKKLFLIAAALVASAFAAQAAVVQANCSRVAQYSDAKALGAVGCQVGDKVFANFGDVVGTTGIPDNWQLTLDIDPDTGDHVVNFASGSTGSILPIAQSPWGVQYDIKIDTTYPGSLYKYFAQVGISLDLSGLGPVGTLTKTITNLDPNHGTIGDLLARATVPPVGVPVTFAYASQYIHVVEVITSTKGSLMSFTDVYSQANIPEPATYGMMGLGLAALGLISRRKKA
ncbi:MAG TPA: PEP-CTERM sorting domain-containing protein [Paludibaculum sp.]|jgi:hypothetical protein